MNRNQKAVFLISAAVVLGVCVGLVLIEIQTRVVRRWVDDVLYDNRNHDIPCAQLPPASEVERIIGEHQDLIQQIEAVNPGFIGIEVNPCGEGNADITFSYASHKDRMAIEQIIGGDTFFGVPYNLLNR